MHRFFPFFLFLLIDCTLAFSQRGASVQVGRQNFNTLDILREFTESNLENYTYVLSTPDSTLQIEQILSRRFEYKLLENEIPDLGMDGRYHWIAFKVRNDTDFDIKLVSYLQLNELNDVSFFLVNRQNQVVDRYEHLNSYTHITKKPIPNPYFAFPFLIPSNEEMFVYWRVHRKHGSVVLPLRLYDIEQFYSQLTVYNFFAFLSYGLLAFTFILSAILYLTTKRKLLFYYAGYCLFYLILCLSNEGILKQVFHLDVRYVEDNARMIISSILLYFIVNFSFNFLFFGDTVRWARILTNGLSYWSLSLSVIVTILPLSSKMIGITNLTILVVIVYAFSLIFYGMFKRKRAAFVYFIALFPFFFNSIWLTSIILFNVHATWFYYEMILYQTIFEFVILGLELAHRMFSEREESMQKLNIMKQSFTSDILQAQDLERQRIAADLHDDLGGTLAVIRMKLNTARRYPYDLENLTKELDEIEPLIQKTSEDLRRISHNLMPPEFERIGLEDSLQQLVLGVSYELTRFEFLVSGVRKQLSTEISLNIYRIISELIQNILKHAKAERASVQLLYFEDYLRIVVEDDGVGIDTENQLKTKTGLGFKTNNLRAEYVGARIHRESSSAGTLVIIEIPYLPEYDQSSAK